MFAVLAVASFNPAHAETQLLTGVTLRGQNNTTSIVLETRAPNETASATVIVSAHTPPNQTTTRMPNQPKLTGFRFLWPSTNDPLKKELVGNQWQQTTKAGLGTVTITPNRVGYNANDRIFPFPGAGEADGVGTGSETALVEAKFPQPGRYRIEIGVIANWWSGTADEYEGVSEIMPLDMNVLNVQNLQYRLAQNGTGQGNFVDVPATLNVPLNQQVEFQAVATPSGVLWPTDTNNKPEWSSTGNGVTGATGKADSKFITFAALGDKSVTATYGNAKPANVFVFEVKATFINGLVGPYGSDNTSKLRMCAGAVADDDVHSGVTTVQVTRNGQPLGGATIELSLDTTGVNFNRTGIVPPKLIQAYNGTQTVQPDQITGKISIVTPNDGKVTVRVLSSNLISQAKLVASHEGKIVGSAICDFAAAESKRRFPNQYDSNEVFPDDDTGWLFDFPHFDAPGRTTPAKVYLKFMINPALGDVYGNWKGVNGHKMRFYIESIVLHDETIIGVASPQLQSYAAVVNPIDPQAITTEKDTASDGSIDGAAQVTVRAGEQIEDAEIINVGAEDQTQTD